MVIQLVLLLLVRMLANKFHQIFLGVAGNELRQVATKCILFVILEKKFEGFQVKLKNVCLYANIPHCSPSSPPH